MRRFGFAIRVGGDPEISGALAAGIEKGTTETSSGPAGHLPHRRVNMMRHTPQEWAEMTEEARVLYGGRRYLPRWAERLLVGYAMICMGVSWLYHQQEKILQ